MPGVSSEINIRDCDQREKLQRALKVLDEEMVKSLDGVFEHLGFEPESSEDRVYIEDVDISEMVLYACFGFGLADWRIDYFYDSLS